MHDTVQGDSGWITAPCVHAGAAALATGGTWHGIRGGSQPPPLVLPVVWSVVSSVALPVVVVDKVVGCWLEV